MRLTCLLQVFIAAAFLGATTAAWAGPEEDYRKGLNARAANDVVGAMASFTAALDSDPGHADAAFERGRLLLLIGEPLNAIADFTTAIIGNPGNGQAYALRGQAKATLGDGKARGGGFRQGHRCVSRRLRSLCAPRHLQAQGRPDPGSDRGPQNGSEAVNSRGCGRDRQNPRQTTLRFGDPGRIRTCDLVLRRHSLYPTELRGHCGFGRDAGNQWVQLSDRPHLKLSE